MPACSAHAQPGCISAACLVLYACEHHLIKACTISFINCCHYPIAGRYGFYRVNYSEPLWAALAAAAPQPATIHSIDLAGAAEL